jgi:hypothetical protein
MLCAITKKHWWRGTDKMKPKFSEGNQARIFLKNPFIFPILTNNEVARQFQKTPKHQNLIKILLGFSDYYVWADK